MGQERLSSLALLSIERGLTEAIDFHPCDRQVRDTQSKKDQAVMKELLATRTRSSCVFYITFCIFYML